MTTHQADDLLALTVWQPYASLLVAGLKQYETRSWSTSHTGPLAIHAGKSFDEQAWIELKADWSRTIRGLAFPTRAIVGVCRLDVCVPARDARRAARTVPMELDFGDFRPGRWAWRMRSPRIIEPPIPCAGNRGLWRVPIGIRDRVLAAIGEASGVG